MRCPLREAARAHPDRVALIAPGHTFTFLQMDAAAEHASAQVRAAGIVPASAVAIHLPQSERYALLLLALIRAGCIAAPLNSRIPPAGLPPLLRRIGATHLVTENAEVAAAAAAALVMPVVPSALLGGGTAPAAAELTPIAFAASHPATIVFTSGSTGEPKAALHSLGNHSASAAGSNQNIPLAPGDCWLLSLSLYHVGGIAILFRCLLAGATVVIPGEGAGVAESIEQHRISHASLVSTQLQRLLRSAGQQAPDHLRALLLGGSAIPPDLLADAHARGFPVHTSYGMTEMASQITTTAPGAPLAELLSSGRSLPGRELKIGADGEILVRGETVFLGYLDGDGLHPARDADGWFHTGDLGGLDDAGLLRVAGRADNQFISGGENIQPEEIERGLLEHPGIEEAVVVPVPDREWGQRPVAFVRGAALAQPAALARWLEQRLPRFMIPVGFLPWPPGGEGMKRDRTALRERAVREVRR